MSTTITALPSAVAEQAGYVVVDQGSGPVATVALSVPSMQMNWMTGLDAAGNAIPTSSTTIQTKVSGQGTSSGSTQSVILGSGTTAYSNNNVIIGLATGAGGYYSGSGCIGLNSNVDDASVIIGAYANGNKHKAVGVGYLCSPGDYGVAIGLYATPGANAVGLGNDWGGGTDTTDFVLGGAGATANAVDVLLTITGTGTTNARGPDFIWNAGAGDGAGTAGNLILGSPAVLAQITSAAAPNSALFWSTTLAQFAWKDSGGTTHATNWI